MIYGHLIKKNEQFGIKPGDICKFAFNCEPEQISENVIMVPRWQPEIFEKYADTISLLSEINYIYKLWTIEVNKKKITYINTYMGAPKVIDAVFALSFTPCKNIVFVGSVGGLDEKTMVGDLIIPEYSVCGDGACRYLTDEEIAGNDCFGVKYFPNKKMYEKIILETKKITEKNNVNWHIGKNFSIDTILLEFSHIDEIIRMGCNCIECETAAFFKASIICGIKSCALFSVSDNVIKNKSLLSGRTKEEMEYRENVRKNILTKIVIECLAPFFTLNPAE